MSVDTQYCHGSTVKMLAWAPESILKPFNINININNIIQNKIDNIEETVYNSKLDVNDNMILAKHAPDVLDLCLRCYNKLKLNWKEVIKQFKASHIIGQKGKILDNLFLNILRQQGVVMTVWEAPKLTHSFRVFGMSGVTDFVEFIRICQLAR